MVPDVVTFWHGPLDPLRLTCLRSQVAAGHRVTVYSFEPLGPLPDGVGNAEAEAILPHAFSEKLRPPQPDGSWRDWTILQFSDFFRMRLMARNAGLWLDADALLLTPDWLALRHRLIFAFRKLRGGSIRVSDIRVAIFGPAALTALARRAGELR